MHPRNDIRHDASYTQDAKGRPLSLLKAEAKLLKCYQWRRQRYAKSHLGRGCFAEDNMASEIVTLEAYVEDLGGDLSELWRRLAE